MRLVSSLCTAVLLGLVPPQVFADELRLKNGDRYSGTVIALDGGTLTFKTAHGQLAIPWSEVTALSVDEEIIVKTAGGEEGSRAAVAIDVAATVGLRRPQPPLVVTGGASAGFVATGGNTDVSSLRVDGDAGVRQRDNRYSFGAAVNRARTVGVETARNWTATMRYDRFLSRRMFVNGSGIFTHDPFRDLDLRTALGAGLGYQLLETPVSRLSVEGGAGYVRQNFDATPDDSYAALREAATLEVLLAAKRVVLFHQHDGYFGVTGDDNLFLKAQNGVRLALVAGFVATAQVDVDYDRSPAPGRRSTDRTFALTFGYRF
jgi:putative salt-induced outer membrane protein YdiY